MKQPSFKYENESKIFTGREINVTNKQSTTLTTNNGADMYASIANTTTVNQPTATASAAHPSTVAPSTVNESTVRHPCRHKINVVRAKFGHNKLFKLFTSVAVTDDSTTTAKTLIDSGATLDFVSRAFLQDQQARNLLSRFLMVLNKDPSWKLSP